MNRTRERLRRLSRPRAFRLVSGTAALLVAACSHDAVGPPVATQVGFSTQPSTMAAGAMMPAVQVEVRDASGTRMPSGVYTVTVFLGRNPGRATLVGTTTQAAVNGVATFSNLTISAADTGYTLRAASGTLAGATSTAFTVTPAAAAWLVFTVQPDVAVHGHPITPPVQVEIQDAFGNTVTTATNAVSMALGSNPGRGMLSGATTVTAANGVATFATLVIDSVGTGYTLAATSGTLSGTTSVPFSVADSSTGIFYHGGPIIYAQKVAALYWSTSVIYANGPALGTSGTPSADQSLVGFFLRNLGGSGYFNINTTYYDATQTHVQNVVTYTQYWADAHNPPDTTDAAIQAEIEAGFSSGALAYDSTTLYAVFTGPGANPGGGFGTQYCAYHSYFIYGGGRNVKYAVLPYDYDFPNACADLARGSPNNDFPADAEVNTLVHEIEETTTDENLDAWYVDANGYENGDLCAWQIGTTYQTANRSQANQSLGGKDFLIQMNWVNASKTDGTPVGCVQHWP